MQAPRFANPKIYLKAFHDVLNITGAALDRMQQGEEGWLDAMGQALPDLKNHGASRRLRRDRAGQRRQARIKASTTASVGGISFTASVSAYNTPATSQFAVLIDRPFGVTGLTEAWRLFAGNDSIVFTRTRRRRRRRSATRARHAGGGGHVDRRRQRHPDSDGGVGVCRPRWRPATTSGWAMRPAPSSRCRPRSRRCRGLYAAVDDGTLLSTYMGVTRTNERLMKARVLDTSASYNSQLSEVTLERGDDMLTDRKSKIKVIVTSKNGARQYRQSLRGDRLFMGNATGRGGTQTGQKGQTIILGTGK